MKLTDCLNTLSQHIRPPIIVEAEYLITTPMFIGDAQQKATTISASSVKGALRFWWRSMNWSNALAQFPTDRVLALRYLHRQEAELFGSAAYTVDTVDDALGDLPALGKGRFSLKIEGRFRQLTAKELDSHSEFKLSPNAWPSYLLGLGLIEYDSNLRHSVYSKSRSALQHSTRFKLLCECDDEETAEALKDVLMLWGLLGGLGSRSRKGLGSVSISSLKGRHIPSNDAELVCALQQLLPNNTSAEPPFSAFSNASTIKVSPCSTKTAWTQLSDIAKVMQMYRGWGFSKGEGEPHLINGLVAEHSSYSTKLADHEWVYDIAKSETTPATAATSMVFGLPRSYGLSQQTYNLKFEPLGMRPGVDGEQSVIDANRRSRRASPLFIHVHQFPNKQTAVVQTFLPAKWLPDQDKLDVYKKRGRDFVSIGQIDTPPITDWSVIQGYLSLDAFQDWKKVTL